jgi:hypothetical protein
MFILRNLQYFNYTQITVDGMGAAIQDFVRKLAGQHKNKLK